MLYLNHNNQTIYALSTPFGKSALAVFRISGVETIAILSKLTGYSKWNTDHMVRHMVHKKIFYQDQFIDFPMIIYFKAPNSYTGEDSAEITIHGSIAIIEQLSFALSCMPNTRMAKNGEFTFRAFMNGKMDLVEAEALRSLIDSETVIQKDLALSHMEGNLSKTLNEIKKSLIKILSQLQAFIDFSDDVDDTLLFQSQQDINKLYKKVQILLNSHTGELIQQGFNVVLAGATNSGKSTIMNWFTKQDTSIVSHIPGTTRDVVKNSINFHGFYLHLFDTAGIRNTNDSIEKEGIRRSYNTLSKANILLYIIDSQSKTYSMDYLKAKDILLKNKLHGIVIFNKEDTLIPNEKKNLKHQYPDVYFSSFLYKTGIQAIEKEMVKNFKPKKNQPFITQDRHRELLSQILQNLSRCKQQDHAEILCEYIQKSLDVLGELLGFVYHEDILDVIFSKFCIGK